MRGARCDGYQQRRDYRDDSHNKGLSLRCAQEAPGRSRNGCDVFIARLGMGGRRFLRFRLVLCRARLGLFFGGVVCFVAAFLNTPSGAQHYTPLLVVFFFAQDPGLVQRFQRI